jgi:hypothetical protein
MEALSSLTVSGVAQGLLETIYSAKSALLLFLCCNTEYEIAAVTIRRIKAVTIIVPLFDFIILLLNF